MNKIPNHTAVSAPVLDEEQCGAKIAGIEALLPVAV